LPLLSDWEENLLLLSPTGVGVANAGDGQRDCDDRIGNDAYCREDDGSGTGGTGGVHSVSSAHAGADVALGDTPEVDSASERRSRLRLDCC
jgi:hypothetical protein